ncbi:hypothetical protein AVDCRST_MAG84-6437 [uncultured Microcoleus sp.]|uniref:Uncharacterized protein n=1 Tax=uncultured Microcoleus sp. TaxID=259945 RepID=A0A6J4PDX2_9CYAN|nr:hypothetical protein AVDCRST_MAG84-6437 [uncultured Microcoleus sp.]
MLTKINLTESNWVDCPRTRLWIGSHSFAYPIDLRTDVSVA